jgi:hypothetical protein
MKKDIVNKPYKSRWIGRLYISLTMLIAFIYIIIYYAGIQEASLFEQTVFSSIMIAVFSLILITTASFYNTKYKIKDGMLTSWSPFMFIKIKLRDIKNVEKTLFPFNIRVGASFYCGIFYVPNIGWVRTIVTNLRDVILITTKDNKHYMISPSKPERFIKQLKK